MKETFLLLGTVVLGLSQTSGPLVYTSYTLPTDKLISEHGPSFRVADGDLPSPLTLIAYGDQRFTDPQNVQATNPKIRQGLVNRLAEEKPAAVVLNGDVPLDGKNTNDYAVFRSETKVWRDAGLHVFPALGNHEFHGDPQQALENWWSAFPEMRNRRWYAAQLGSRVYVLALDSDAMLLPGSDQRRWIEEQFRELPPSIDLVLITMHHPPVADFQQRFQTSHNPRPNEIALRDYLTAIAPKTHARIIVSAGHIHNYERQEVAGVIYFVAGGGGAQPYPVERTRDDLWQSDLFPNYHYVKFTVGKDAVHGQMFRVDPNADQPKFEVKDEFEIALKR